MADIAYISDFLNTDGVEGKCQTQGYIPCRPRNFTGVCQDPSGYTAIGASGVTVATGCDLGQTDAETLAKYGLDRGIVNQLFPYFGQKKQAAIAKLAALPLAVSLDTAHAIDHAVHEGYLNLYVRPAFEKAAGVSFDKLPKQAQAAIFSICFQKGCGGTRRDCPKLWHYFTTQDWVNASRELKYGFKQYTLRRRIEGGLLEELE